MIGTRVIAEALRERCWALRVSLTCIGRSGALTHSVAPKQLRFNDKPNF